MFALIFEHIRRRLPLENEEGTEQPPHPHPRRETSIERNTWSRKKTMSYVISLTDKTDLHHSRLAGLSSGLINALW